MLQELMKYKYSKLIGALCVPIILLPLCLQYYFLHTVTTAYTSYTSYYEYVYNIRNLKAITSEQCYATINPDLNEGLTLTYKIATESTTSSPNKVVYHLGFNPHTIVYTENDVYLIELKMLFEIKSIIIRREV